MTQVAPFPLPSDFSNPRKIAKLKVFTLYRELTFVSIRHDAKP
jgi:hypothetical protein